MGYEQEAFLGSGDLQIDVFNENGERTGELDVGNATVFAINAPSLEKKEQTGMRRANYGQTIKSVITKIEQELKFTLTDINRENLALAMFGEDSAYSQTAGNNTGSAESVTVHAGRWTKLSHRNLDSSSGNKPVVKNSAGTTTYDEGDDYEIDYQVGRIRPVAGGSISDGDELKVECKWLALTGGWKVAAQKTNKIEAFIRLIGKDQANDRNCEVIVHRASIEPSGDINWLTEDFAQLEFTGKILATADGTWDVIFY